MYVCISQELLSRETHKTGVVNFIHLVYSSPQFSHTLRQNTILQTSSSKSQSQYDLLTNTTNATM